jgi:hypothetical protein
LPEVASTSLSVVGAFRLNATGPSQGHWIAYRSAWEALRREQHLYDAPAGVVTARPARRPCLAERIDELIPREHGRWVSVQEATARGRSRASDQG